MSSDDARAVRELTVFFPAYNEEGSITQVVEAAIAQLDTLELTDYEAIVIDDGSVDGTGCLADRLAADHDRVRTVHHERNRGYGAALKSGFAASRFEWVFFTDADGQFDLSELPAFLAAAAQYDVVVGYRKARQDRPMRRFNAWAWAKIVRVSLGLQLRDVDCAYKLIRRSRLVEAGSLRSEGAFLSTELLVKLLRNGVELCELPVAHHAREAGRPSGGSPIVIFRAFVDLARELRHLN